MSDRLDLDAVVVGSGFAGLYALRRLRMSGLSVRCFESGGGIGGTWYWNRYPGARCDVESFDYSYSFSEDLQQAWEWTERYATQPEILAYIEYVADRFDLRRDIQLNTRVDTARYVDDEARWRVTLSDGTSLLARYCILATGALSEVSTPNLPGIDEFRGEILHTARWRSLPGGMRGRRVGVIGTGSSGIQVISELAREVERLYVFQRTANFCMPARNAPLSADQTAAVKATYSERRRIARRALLGVPMPVPRQSALELSEDERLEAFEAGWQEGGANAIVLRFTDVSVDEAANNLAANFIRSKIRETVHDPLTAEALVPRGYPLGAKRVCVGTDYYETFNLEHVSLVDLRRAPIQRITSNGIVTDDGEYNLDTLVFATGFDALTGSILAIDIEGREGLRLRDAWADGPHTNLGIMSAGFPNLFCICGPQSPSVASNMVLSIEQHVDWIADCIDWLESRGLVAIEPTVAAQDEWGDHVQKVAGRTLQARADSWYIGANIPGKPRVFMPYLGGVGVYRAKCDKVAASGYTGFEVRPARAVLAESS